MQIEGFPNLFTLVGPHNAATFCNIPRCIEQNVDWVTALTRHMREKGYARVEAERGWTEHVRDTGWRILVHPGRFLDDGHDTLAPGPT